jgi:hypothetical protein
LVLDQFITVVMEYLDSRGLVQSQHYKQQNSHRYSPLPRRFRT